MTEVLPDTMPMDTLVTLVRHPDTVGTLALVALVVLLAVVFYGLVRYDWHPKSRR